jgi:hypothetical protein
MSAKRKVAVLFRKDEKESNIKNYAIHGMMKYWAEHNILLEPIFGPSTKRPFVDLMFVHVNLSVVPSSYLDYASQFPIVLNGKISDIRKSVVCDHLINASNSSSQYQGPVIIKSDLNAAGLPEAKADHKIVRRLKKAYQWIKPPALKINKQQDYQIFSSLRNVPDACFLDKKIVIQKFFPEVEDGFYHVRSYSFLGGRHSCMRISSADPVIHLGNGKKIEVVEPHPEIIAIRQKLNMDYGKLDYVLHNGIPILFDVNKTLGASRNETNSIVLSLRRERAKGLFPYLDLPCPSE